MAGLVAVVDLGKSNSKVALVDSEAQQELKVIKQPSAVRTDKRYPCIDHQAIDQFVAEALLTLNRFAEFDALTVTTHGATVALINRRGELTLPVMDYEFEGVDELSADYDAIRPGFTETGSPRLPGGLNIGAQLYWQQARFAADFASTHAILTWPQYWIHQFCGALHNDVSSLGAHSDLYCPAEKRYSTLVSNQGWNTLMPPTKPSGGYCADLSSTWLQRIERKKTLAVYTGIHDSNASLVPHLKAHDAPFTVVSTGTWFIAMAIGGNDVTLDEKRDTLFNVSALGEPVPSARFMGGRERELLMPSHTASDRASGMQTLLNAGNDNTSLLMPSAVTGTGPYPDKEALWINEPTDISVRDCLVTLYLSMMTAECLMLIGAAGPIYVEGPLAADHLYNQQLSVATNRPVFVSAGETGTSVGAAMLVYDVDVVQRYQAVTVDQTLSQFLTSYAVSWRSALERHAR